MLDQTPYKELTREPKLTGSLVDKDRFPYEMYTEAADEIEACL